MTRAQARVARRTRVLRDRLTLTTIADRDAYALPATFLEETLVLYLTASDSTQARLRPRPPAYAQGEYPTEFGGISFYYIAPIVGSLRLRQIVLWPEPTVSVDSIFVDMIHGTGTINEGDSTFELPEPVHDAILWETIVRVGELAQAAMPLSQMDRWRRDRDEAMGEARASASRLVGQLGAAVPTPY